MTDEKKPPIAKEDTGDPMTTQRFRKMLNKVTGKTVQVTETDKPLPPTTTQQEDNTVAGQRRINMIWEITQSTMAVMITLAVIYCAINKIGSQEITNAFFLIVGFYFSRTNHQRIGGVGSKANENQMYQGR